MLRARSNKGRKLYSIVEVSSKNWDSQKVCIAFVWTNKWTAKLSGDKLCVINVLWLLMVLIRSRGLSLLLTDTVYSCCSYSGFQRSRMNLSLRNVNICWVRVAYVKSCQFEKAVVEMHQKHVSGVSFPHNMSSFWQACRSDCSFSRR